MFCLPASQLAVRPDCVKCMAPEFLRDKGDYVGFRKLVLMNIYPLCHGVSFYPLLLSFRLQIAYRKMSNQISVDKLVEKASINLLHHEKSTCIISIIIDAPTVLTSIVSS